MLNSVEGQKMSILNFHFSLPTLAQISQFFADTDSYVVFTNSSDAQMYIYMAISGDLKPL